MIRLLHLQNFKCFENQSLQFRPLTLLSGLNGTGKSSVLQSLLLLRQSYQQSLLPSTGLALLFEGAKEDKIGLDLVLTNEIEGSWCFDYDREADVLSLASPPVAYSMYESSLFRDNFQYLQAERLGPRRFSEMSDFLVRQHRQLGPRGEFTAHFLSVFERSNIPSRNMCHPNTNSLDLFSQVQAWIGEVCPGIRLLLTPNLDMNTISLQYFFIMGNQVSNKYRPTNVGFGITYTLPVIVAVLSSVPDSLILIENPEAHLHPSGQAKIGSLLALAASSGIQVVVETHSDHVLNGIRLAVHDGKLSPDDVQVHFFQRKEQDGQSLVTSPQIDRDGRIDKWPDGFFDEWDKSLEALLEPRDM